MMAGFRDLLMLCDDLVKPLIPLYQKYSLVSPRTFPEREQPSLFVGINYLSGTKHQPIFYLNTVQRWFAVIFSTSPEHSIFVKKNKNIRHKRDVVCSG